MDECYTYYGITHETFGEFVESIYSGINFSPPLYFLINWLVQLIFSISIETLRMQSALWISLGAFLIFARCIKSFGFLPSFLSLTLILLQSNLLIGQAMEARHYGMFFAVSCLVLFLFTSDSEPNSQNRKTLYFISLLALGLTHYLGIVFCAITGLARFWCLRKEGSTSLLPLVEISCCTILTGIYLTLLHKQSSHLGAWVKDNSIEALVDQYFGSALPLSILGILIPMLIFLPRSTSQNLKEQGIKNKSLAPLLTVSALWLFVPFFFWVLSHISFLNLYKERYFIPKEAATIIIVSFGINKLKENFGGFKTLTSQTILAAICMVSFGIFALNAKRIHFSLDPPINYHHWLCAEDKIFQENIPILFSIDPLFFPNAYRFSRQSYFLLDQREQNQLYKKFSKEIRVTDSDEIKDFNEFILISEKKEKEEFLRKGFVLESEDSFNKFLPFVAYRFRTNQM